MRHLNYSHLQYFWAVAREGSIIKASEVLHLTPQTISGQLKLLEESVGEELFTRVGRGLVLTEAGHLVFQYADEIFSLGAELSSRLKTGSADMPANLRVGIVNSIPKLIAMRILQPSLTEDNGIKLVCVEGNFEELLGKLAVHQLDMIISDHGISAGLNVKAFTHQIGQSGTTIFVKRSQARRYEKQFPASLNGSPLLLPTQNNPMRRALEEWMEQLELTPNIIAEFDDSALMKAFGEEGLGLFPSPTAIANEIELMYDAKAIGGVPEVVENYYAISPERRLKHPVVLNIIESARDNLFG